MNQRYILGLVLLAAGLILTAGCGSSPQLAWCLQEGDRFAVKVHLVSDLAMMFGGVDHKDSYLELDCLVKQIDPNQQATVEATIGSIKASMSSLGQKYAYDSENDPGRAVPKKGRPGHTQTFINAFTGIKGKTFTTRVDPQSRQVRLVKLNPQLKKIAYAGAGGNMLGGDQINMLLSEGHLREYVSGGFFFGYPVAPARKNAAWTAHGSALVPYAPVTPTLKQYTVQAIEKTPEKETIARIGYQISMDANPPGRPPSPVKPSAKLTFKTDNVEGSGEVTFSLTRGQPLKITEKSKVTVSSRNKPVRPAPTPGSKPRPKVNIFYTVQKTIEYPLPADPTGESLNESKTKEPPAQNR